MALIRMKLLPAILLNMLSAAFITGCVRKTLSDRVIPLEESHIVQETSESAIPLYYEFKDVPVPWGLEINRERSFVFQTAESAIGLISFSGDLESEFLISFFKSKMPKDGWRLLGSFKSLKNVLLFLKENRFCVISIVSKALTAEVEILLAPGFQESQKHKEGSRLPPTKLGRFAFETRTADDPFSL